MALLNGSDLQTTYEELGVAQADLVQAGLLANPTISAEIRFPGRPNFPVEANLEDEFLQLFFLPLRQKVAQAQLEQSQGRRDGCGDSSRGRAREAFYRYQGALQLVDVRQTVLAAAAG